MKGFMFFLTACLLIAIGFNLHANERDLNQKVNEEYETLLKTNEFDFHLAQRRAETWQPYVENLYKNARTFKNIAYISSTASFVVYITLHRRITFGHIETEDIERSLTQLNLICGSVAIGSLLFYIWGNSLENEANQIITKDSFSLQMGKNGIGIVYKL